MKLYITFGQTHIHIMSGIMLNHLKVLVIPCESREQGRQRAFKLLGDKWCFSYANDEWDVRWMRFYPGGYVTLSEEAAASLDEAPDLDL